MSRWEHSSLQAIPHGHDFFGMLGAMGFIAPTPPPYDPLEWEREPFSTRVRQACEAWALQGYGTPIWIILAYGLKVGVYVSVWALSCSLASGLGAISEIGTWWLEPVAFQKAIVWSMLFEILGLGCGSGPLTGRYMPPLGGCLYFLRPGTTKLPLFAKAPLIGGHTRSIVDVLAYAAVCSLLIWALISPTLLPEQLWPLLVLVPVLGILDKTLFLAARGEHYWTTLVVFAFADDWIAGAMAVQLALWFWAGFSKLNHHFPMVVCTMTSNSPIMRSRWLRKRMYRDYPRDLRPSGLATVMAHSGTALEFSAPIVLLFGPLIFGPGGTVLIVGMILVVVLHGYITSNVPVGVPIEWNVMVVYGAFALFWAHPEVSALSLGPPALAAFVIVVCVVVPLVGNLVPQHVSFLLAMRYYAGNWPYSVWLFRGESQAKLERLTKTSPDAYVQLETFYDHRTAVGLFSLVVAFRMMHLQGRALAVLVPKAVADLEGFELDDYQYVDGEVVAGLALGWNFGDGHLHQEQLLEAVQAQCEFEPGELRCVFVEAQPFARGILPYRLVDAVTGQLEAGELSIAQLRERQPWVGV